MSHVFGVEVLIVQTVEMPSVSPGIISMGKEPPLDNLCLKDPLKLQLAPVL